MSTIAVVADVAVAAMDVPTIAAGMGVATGAAACAGFVDGAEDEEAEDTTA